MELFLLPGNTDINLGHRWFHPALLILGQLLRLLVLQWLSPIALYRTFNLAR